MIGRQRKCVLAIRFSKDNPFQVPSKQVIPIGSIGIIACQMQPEMSSLPFFEGNPLEFKLQDDCSRLSWLFPKACLLKDKGLYLDIIAGFEQTGGPGNGDRG